MPKHNKKTESEGVRTDSEKTVKSAKVVTPKIHLSKFLNISSTPYTKGQVAVLRTRFGREMHSVSKWETLIEVEFTRTYR